MTFISLEKYKCKEILEDEDVLILNKLAYSSYSLYKLQKCTKVPLTSLWRIINKLIEKEYVLHQRRGIYALTLKGALALYLTDKEEYKNSALYFISFLFPYKNIKNVIDCTINLLLKRNTCILNLVSLHGFENVYPYIINALLQGEKLKPCMIEFILDNYIDEIPYTSLDGCKLFIVIHNGAKKIVLGKCKVLGNLSNGYCSHIEKIDEKKMVKIFL
ncbi:hypothetical protein EWF20_09900 [Sulfolobus sp. S-194]|uniref:hypothetical protein n=1 Tax=Sulfolobus sp. S-194 TaxID=2512240 RepID=UPI001436D17A|nr:hypothetical protein [Sulfolobus sp. S-194]QIW24433.1 hypothetical protein EWF20_09900 [Sulfolobus sp. S-194]